ncbi:CotH kinase family protein [bacterium]|nr:CotH kinase family protein [bacterium]
MRPFSVILSFALLSAFFAEGVRINEFLASNKSGLKDSFGEFSDWIEIYNDSDEELDLAGYGLSDSAKKPFKWTFPATNLTARGYLLVFASDVMQCVPGKELHTGFKLSAEGEYLGLAQPDGKVVSEFYPAFPPQYPDVSYGWCGEAETEEAELMKEKNPCRVCVPGNGALDNVWYLPDYDDSTFLKGSGGVGFECNKGGEYDFSKYFKVNIKEAMYKKRRAAFIRYPFVLADAPAFYTLSMSLLYCDSFEAYLNGVPITREDRMSGSGAEAYALSDRAKKDALVWTDFDVTKHRMLLHTGTNLLAIVGTVADKNDEEFLISPKLTGGVPVSFTNETLQYMQPASPGYPNRDGFQEIIGKVSPSEDPGFYEEPFELRLLCDLSDAKIKYTLDGTVPSSDHGTVYKGRFKVDKTTIVRAKAFKDDAGGAVEFVGTYVFLDDVINAPDGVPPGDLWPTNSVNGQRMDYGMDVRITQSDAYKDAMRPGMQQLPFISIITSPGNLFSVSTGIYVNARSDGELWERPAHVELLNHDGKAGFSINCGLRIRGAASRAAKNPKHGFRLFFRDEYDGKLKFPLFEDEGADSFRRVDLRCAQNYSWNFENDAYQAIYCRDAFVRDLALSLGLTATRSRSYHLLLNGHYWGLYQTEERPEEHFAASYLGGSKDDYDVIKVDDFVISAVSGDTKAFRRLYKMTTNGFDSASYKSAVETGLLDPTNVADNAILNNIVCNMDCPVAVTGHRVNNFYALYNKIDPQGFKFICHDNEHSLVRAYYNTNLTLKTTVGEEFKHFNYTFLHQELMKCDPYRELFIDRVCKRYFNGGAVVPENLQALFMRRANSIYDAIVCESARWGDIRAPYGDRLPLRRDRDWKPNIDYLRDKFLPHRHALNLEQFRAAGWFPEFDPPILSLCGGTVDCGTELTLTGAKKIVYTLDGSDPWDSQTAKVYADSPVVLTNSLLFRCCYAKGEISFPMRGEAKFTVETPEPAIGFLILLFLPGKRRILNV